MNNLPMVTAAERQSWDWTQGSLVLESMILMSTFSYSFYYSYILMEASLKSGPRLLSLTQRRKLMVRTSQRSNVWEASGGLSAG